MNKQASEGSPTMYSDIGKPRDTSIGAAKGQDKWEADM